MKLLTQENMDNAIVKDVFGVLGAVCWSIQLLPQVILNYRRHSAAGLSPAFMLSWAFAGIPLGVYNIVSGFSIALQVQPQILTALSLVTWGQCHYYERKWSIGKVLAVAGTAGCVLGGIETGLVFALHAGREQGTTWPLTLMAVLAAVLLALGVCEQYLGIWKSRSVEGISFLFCGIDALGDVTSIISVIFGTHLDILGLVIYGVEFVMWMGVFSLGFYLRWHPWLSSKLHRRHHCHDEPSDEPSAAGHGIALHDLPSSTSVFRTASTQTGLHHRVGAA